MASLIENSTSSNTTEHSSEQQETLQEKLHKIQIKWNDIIAELNGKFQNLVDVDNLLNTIYTKRQDLVDYYYSILNIYGKLMQKYKVDSAAIYNKLKMGSNNIRYTNETSLNNQIEAALAEQKNQIILFENHLDFCKETLKSIDNMIYGISQKIRLFELINGIKK